MGTVKLVTTSQACTASTLHDTHAIGQSANIRPSRFAKAVFFREEQDPTAIAGTYTIDTFRQEAVEVVWTGGTSAV